MEFAKKLITLFSVLFVLSVSFGSYIGTDSQTIVSIDNCEKEVEVIVEKRCVECEEFTPRVYAEPQATTPKTVLTPFEVAPVEKIKTKEVEVQVISNVKFGEIYCDDCQKEVEVREYSEPTRTTKKTVVSTIIEYVANCFK